MQEQVAATPGKVAVAKPMPRAASSPKSTFKRKRFDDLEGGEATREQAGRCGARRGETGLGSAGRGGAWRSELEARAALLVSRPDEKRRAEAEESVVSANTGPAPAGKAMID